MQIIKELFDSVKRNGNHKVIISLSYQLKNVTDSATELKAIDFVDIVIKDYNFYTQQL